MSFGHNIVFKISEPKHGGWFCFDLTIKFNGGENIRELHDIEAHDRWYQRAWHWIAQPVRKARGYGRVRSWREGWPAC